MHIHNGGPIALYRAPAPLLMIAPATPAVPLAAATASAFLLRNFAVGQALTPPMCSFLAALAMSNTGVMAAAHPWYDGCASVALPLAVALSLLSAPGEGGNRPADGKLLRPVLYAFVLGAVGTLLGALVAFRICFPSLLSQSAAATAAGLMSATYIGGSANFFGVAVATRAAECHPGLLPSLLAADLGLMGVYLLVLTAAARTPWIKQLLPEKAASPHDQPDPQLPPQPSQPSPEEDAPLAPWLRATFTAGSALFAGAAFRATSALETICRLPGSGTVSLSVLCTFAGRVLTKRAPRVASSIGGILGDTSLILFCLFLASVGASARLAELVVAGPAAATFAAACLVIHCAFMLVSVVLANRLAGTQISASQLIIASNANVGGVGTAIAMAGAMGWSTLVAPAAVVGALGYAIATPLGVSLRAALLRG